MIGVLRRSKPKAKAVAEVEYRHLSRERLTRWLFRTFFVAALAVALFLAGALVGTLLAGSPGPSTGTGGSGAANREQVEGFAQAFAFSYASYDSADQTGYAERMKRFGDSSLADGLWSGQGQQRAVATFVGGYTQRSDGIRVVTVAVLVDSTPADAPAPAAGKPTPAPTRRWLYIAVPVAVQGSQVAVVDKPAQVPAPALLAPQGASAVEEDTALETSLQSTLEAFFKAYCAGDGTQLSYLSLPEHPIAGLDGTLTLKSVDKVVIPTGKSNTRTALVKASFQDHTTGAVLQQSYQLTMTQVAGQWRIASISAGG